MEDVSFYSSVLRRFIKIPSGIIGFLILLFFVLAGLLASILPLANPDHTNPTDRFLPPFQEGHILGTDELGRDILSRIFWGSRLSLGIGCGSALLCMIVGVTLGVIAGYQGGWLDQGVMRFSDMLMSFPYILLSIAIVGVLGPGLWNAMIAVAAVGIPTYARIVRSAILSLREQEYILATKALGASSSRVIWRHLVPNTTSVILIATTLDVGFKITAAAGLSFLGLGVQPPAADWGTMVASGRGYILLAPHVVVFPGAAIFLTVLAFNLLGDALQEVFDPKFLRTMNF